MSESLRAEIFWICLRFFCKTFPGDPAEQVVVGLKITHPLTWVIIRKSLWNLLKWARNKHILKIPHLTTNVWESQSRTFFDLSQIFLQNFSWRSCGAGCGLTEKPQALKRALLFRNHDKLVDLGVYQANFEGFTFDYKGVRVSEQRFFWQASDSVQKLFWRSCRACCGQTLISQISERVLQCRDHYKIMQKRADSGCFEDSDFDMWKAEKRFVQIGRL